MGIVGFSLAWVSGFVRGGTSLRARDEADTKTGKGWIIAKRVSVMKAWSAKSRCSGQPACSQGPQLFSPSLAGRLPNVLLSR